MTPSFGFSATGWKNGQSDTNLTGLAFSTTATPTSNAGGIYIASATGGVLGGAAAGNYTLAYQAGAFSVTPALLTVTADNASRRFGEANPPLTYRITAGGLVNGDQITGALTTAATQLSPAGTYAIEQGTVALSANYRLTFVPGTLTVEASLDPLAGTVASQVTPSSNPWPFVPPMPPLSGDALTNAVNGSGPFYNVPVTICLGGSQQQGSCLLSTSSLGTAGQVN